MQNNIPQHKIDAVMQSYQREPLFAERETIFDSQKLFKSGREGVTRAQMERFFLRLNAVKAAEALTCKNKSSMAAEVRALVEIPEFSHIESLPAGRLRVHQTNGITCVLSNSVAIAYAKVLLNLGDLARNY